MLADLLDLEHPLLWTVDEVLSPTECTALIERIEDAGPELATINRPEGHVVNERVRNNERVTFDDHDLAATLFERVRPHVPEMLKGWRVSCANERFRCYRYKPGQQFAAHYDGSHARSPHERTLLTFMIYLNEGFEGGATTFLDLDRAIVPRTGSALLFQHPILHEGSEVKRGVKYAVRSDIFYRDPEAP